MNFSLAQPIKAWYNAYSFHRNYIGSGIEEVITGLTRNRVGRSDGTRRKALQTLDF